jgi:hypothetical protein
VPLQPEIPQELSPQQTPPEKLPPSLVGQESSHAIQSGGTPSWRTISRPTIALERLEGKDVAETDPPRAREVNRCA